MDAKKSFKEEQYDVVIEYLLKDEEEIGEEITETLKVYNINQFTP